MSKQKKILLIGPISSSGGREVMTNLLINSLQDHYTVEVFSTILMTEKSVALRSFNGRWTNLNLAILNSNFLIKLLAFLSKARSKKTASLSEFAINTISRKLFDFGKRGKSIVKNKVRQHEVVIFSGEIHNNWYTYISRECQHSDIPLILRLTGQVETVPAFFSSPPFPLNILTHSVKNENMLKGCDLLKIWQVDQTTVLERELLDSSIAYDGNLTFGFLGRFTEEKGILQLLDCFKEREDSLIIAGSGTSIDAVEAVVNHKENVSYVGKLSQHEVGDFFSQIDVLIIPSFIEGGPIVGVEAMAAGKLIISTRVGAMEERLKDTGNDFWFDHSKDLDLAICIEKVKSLTEEQHIEIRKRIRQRYLVRNKLEVIQHRYRTIIEEISKSS